MAKCYLLLITLVLVVVGQVHVEGKLCQNPLGACGPAGDCDKRCKALHSDGQGSCDLGLCSCYYTCGPRTPSPVTPKMCTAGLGVCSFQCSDNCCNSKCARTYKQGTGFCNKVGPSTNLCTCQYPCGV